MNGHSINVGKKKPCNASSLLLVSFETFDIDFDEYLVLKKITNYMVTSIGELLLHLDLSIYVFWDKNDNTFEYNWLFTYSGRLHGCFIINFIFM